MRSRLEDHLISLKGGKFISRVMATICGLLTIGLVVASVISHHRYYFITGSLFGGFLLWWVLSAVLETIILIVGELKTVMWMPLMSAAYGDSVKTVRFLLKRGVTVDYGSWDGSTALHHAVKFGSIELVTLLLEHGADPEAKDRDGLTPLAWARKDQSDNLAELEAVFANHTNQGR